MCVMCSYFVCVSVNSCEGQRTMLGVSLCPLPCFRQIFCCSELYMPDWLVYEFIILFLGLPAPPPHLSVGSFRVYECLLCCVWLFGVGSEDSNSVCRDRSASALPTDTSPQLHTTRERRIFLNRLIKLLLKIPRRKRQLCLKIQEPKQESEQTGFAKPHTHFCLIRSHSFCLQFL